MTVRIPDQDRRATLEERPAHEARSAIRGPGAARGGFAVLPVALRDPSAAAPAGVAAAGIVAVLVLALVGGWLDGDAAPRDHGVPATAAPAASNRPPSPKAR